jgi:nitrite reductase/ring-hydroxylating ferredoxin subunit
MGNAMRRYWLPALLSSELPEPEGDPRHVQLLGQDLVAFRDAEGKVGILDELCCHRGASLLLGRVEDRGIRCIYHGWKFAADGTVLDTPNVSDPRFKERIKAPAYPVQEAGGIIWTYLGPKDKCPPFPQWPFFDVPEPNRLTTKHVIECNFVQVLEGLVDSSHLGVLHLNSLRASRGSGLAFANKIKSMQFDQAPVLEAELTDFGFHYAAIREIANQEEECTEVRITAFVSPCFVVNPNGDVLTNVVPASDGRSNFFHVFWDTERRINEEPLRTEHLAFVGLDGATLSNFGLTEEYRGQATLCRQNRFLQDREAMRGGGSFTGLPGIVEEDVVVSVSSGPIRDRSAEHLAAADRAVTCLYKVLLDCTRRVSAGEDPVGLHSDMATVRGVSSVLKPDQTWQALVPGHHGIRAQVATATRAAATNLQR